jgi:hypothetical protein
MSTITIRKTFKIAGVPVDVTSFGIGIIRSDTSEVIVASNTAMTRTGTGVYEYTFTPPTSGLTYAITYTVVYAGQTISLPDTYVDTGIEAVPLPALTGDTLVDTLASLQTERLRVSRAGPKPSYSLHGHTVKWAEYLDYLDKRILALRVEIAQSAPWEEVGVGY